jgi:hypothetical protein
MSKSYVLKMWVRVESDEMSLSVVVTVEHKLTNPSELSAVSDWQKNVGRGAFVPLSSLPDHFFPSVSTSCILRKYLMQFFFPTIAPCILMLASLLFVQLMHN